MRGNSNFLGRQSSPGDVLRASELNELKDALRRNRLFAAEPLELVQTAGGLLLRLVKTFIEIAPASATSAITARVGATPGTGTITFYRWIDPSFALGTETATCRNLYTGTSGVVAINKFLWAVKWQGTWWVLGSDC